MIGSSDELIEKILDADLVLGGLDRFYGQVDWGGLPRPLVEGSMTRFATEIAPAVRTALASRSGARRCGTGTEPAMAEMPGEEHDERGRFRGVLAGGVWLTRILRKERVPRPVASTTASVNT
jgi:hypothetical protein